MTDEGRPGGTAATLLDKPAWAPAWAPSTDDARSLRGLRWALLVLLVAGVAACMSRGADAPADPTLASVPGTEVTTPGGEPAFPGGFGTTAARVRTPVGDELEVCLLVAETTEQRQRGLMEVTDPALAGFDGMLFRFEADTSTGFWMRNTPMPLSIAYLAADGSLVSTADMAPCADDPSCPGYPPAAPFRYALEVPQGRLADVGISPGSVLTDARTPCSP